MGVSSRRGPPPIPICRLSNADSMFFGRPEPRLDRPTGRPHDRFHRAGPDASPRR